MHNYLCGEIVEYTKLEINIEDQIGIITINNPKANTLSSIVGEEFQIALNNFIDNQEVRVIIVTGKGDKFFIAGAEISEFMNKSATEGRILVRKLQLIIHSIEKCPKPVIAAINGYCLGGGMELALACDIRYASENAKLGQPEINLGIIPGAGGTQRLPRLIGKGKAKELIFTGDHISASEALSLQLIQKVSSSQELMNDVKNLAKKIASKSPLIISYAKEAIDTGIEISIEEALILEADKFGLCFGTEDKVEGVSAFLDGREPVFKGK
ncbi:MAG: 3-hydroxypropionyl-coenzyme A dehydratase [Candidatus Heimdallarchaeota archaeon LC_3]|nr:MAG: 3-hydroxypropionyl-coenzyme A dehydratase [Candidatus Heimdallarchaeota archaeon LC_3]